MDIKNLRRNFLHMNYEKRRAGLIVLKKIDNEYKILGLRYYGKFDLPKGHLDEGEDYFEGALREAYEEAHITEHDINFPFGKKYFVQCKDVKLFFSVAKDTLNPLIEPNKETGIVEHHGWKWLSFSEAEKLLHPYLTKIIPEVVTKIKELEK